MTVKCPSNNLMLLLLITGAHTIAGKTYFVTPGSHFYLNTSIPEESIFCYYYPAHEEGRIEKKIIIASGEYDTNKYQIIDTKTEPSHYLAPLEQFSMHIYYKEREQFVTTTCSTKSTNTKCIQERTTIYVTFKLLSVLSCCFLRCSYERRYEKIRLMIMNASTEDDGRYTCEANSFWIKVARLRFLNQTNDNIIYGQEGMFTDISCTTVTGYDAGELSIHQNDKLLATSNSSIVTFSFIPKEHDSFIKFRCASTDTTLGDVHVQFVIGYAPVVKVVRRVNSIDCIANGYPEAYKFYDWEHQSAQGKHVRFLEGLKNGTLNLQTLPQQYQINGKYICSVSNGIPGVNGSTVQRGFGSLSYIGAPIFAPESRNMQDGVFGEPIGLIFLLYSNPIVENIWIEGDDFLANVIHDFRISKTALLYKGSAEKGSIGGYEIAFETHISSYNNNHVYTIWAENKFGVDSYKFQVIGVESLPCDKHQRMQSIASCSIVVGLLVYLIVSQVCFYKSFRKKQTVERYIPQDLNIHNYDEIGPIAYLFVNQSSSDIDHQALIVQTSISHSRQPESATINFRHQISLNDSTVEDPRVSESSDNELHQIFISVAAINTTPASSDEHTVQCIGISSDQSTASSDEKKADNTLRLNQSGIHQDEHSFNSNRSSTSSTCSNGATLSRVIVSDGYENPYQIVMQVNEDPHAYTCITQTEQIGSAKQSHKTDEHTGKSSDQTSASSDLNEADNTLWLDQSRIHRDEYSLNSNRSSTSSTSSRMDLK